MGRIRPANRSQAKPLIGIYSESGAGKTYSALLLARGFVGPQGRICMIETESGRGESYSNPVEYPEIGGYDVLPLRDNFSPETYGGAIAEVEAGKYDALIVDSASHEWEAVGGVLDMASQNQSSGKKGPLVWQKPKIDHQKHFMLKFMQTPIPLVILNMRAKYPMEEAIRNGKKEWARSSVLEPKQSDDILYEMFVHGWISKDTHAFNPTKITAKSLHGVFKQGEPITLQTGKDLAAWAAGSDAVISKTQEPNYEQSAEPLTEEQRIKKLAAEIVSKIRGARNTQELYDILNFDYKSEMEPISKISRPAYDYLNGEFNKRMAILKQESADNVNTMEVCKT